MAMEKKNYTLGRGKVYFSRFLEGTQTARAFRYIGNTPEFNLTIESETLDHYSSDEGIREKDDSVPLEVNRTGSLITDNIDPANVALFFFGSNTTVTQAAVPSTSEVIEEVVKGMTYKLGRTSTNLTGYSGLDTAGFAIAIGSTTLVKDTDYEVDYDTGLITFLTTSPTVQDGEDATVTFAVRGSSRDRVISGSTPVDGAMMYIAHNPKGRNFDYHLPYIKVTPNGDYALKGDEWQQIPFTIEALKPAVGEAIYMDGRPVYA